MLRSYLFLVLCRNMNQELPLEKCYLFVCEFGRKLDISIIHDTNLTAKVDFFSLRWNYWSYP